MTDNIKRLPVWGRWLRLSHWGLALGVLTLIFHWLATGSVSPAPSWVMDLHYYAAALLIPAFLTRLYLLFFGTGSDLLKSLTLDRHKLKQAGAVLSSYLTLGKVPLPKWYAHNPLWGPLYLLLFLLLASQIATGLLLTNQITLAAGISIRSLHILGFQLISGFSALHILAVFVHDLKGTGSDVSAMISGQRIFLIESPPPKSPPSTSTPSSVSLDSLTTQLPANKK